MCGLIWARAVYLKGARRHIASRILETVQKDHSHLAAASVSHDYRFLLPFC
jgi:hypothetical protein